MTSAYAQAGVDIEAGDRAVELMKEHVARSARPEVIGGLGGFAGLFDATALKGYDQPVLVTSTDGVGTKVAIAQALDRHDTIGYDLVGMVVDDIVVVGAEPLFVTDYIACGSVVPERIAAIVQGVAAACAETGAALIGGETAEHPGLLAADEYDLAGAVTGVVEKDRLLGPERVRAGDRVLALASSGLHSNGFSLVRRVLLQQAGLRLDDYVAELGRTLGEELLTPTRLYAQPVLAVLAATEVHAASHITGGGLANNLARVIPAGLHATLDRSTWAPPPIFGLVQSVGHISQPDIEAALNMGVGFALVLPAAALPTAQQLLADAGIATWDCGAVAEGEGGVSLVGAH
ncbi:MAG: phosphoribosylformylglycinamidine cyclo-ligase [Propionibacteriaceae bacterium]|jgi:phosphoribosylformylglycinamidine cyclo-ligase|nr:phosphoribosylformylglycinamidine cyclo-ligase [Propionibacteriaceae bacterium]